MELFWCFHREFSWFSYMKKLPRLGHSCPVWVCMPKDMANFHRWNGFFISKIQRKMVFTHFYTSFHLIECEAYS